MFGVSSTWLLVTLVCFAVWLVLVIAEKAIIKKRKKQLARKPAAGEYHEDKADDRNNRKHTDN